MPSLSSCEIGPGLPEELKPKVINEQEVERGFSFELFLLVADSSLAVGTRIVEAVVVSTQYKLSRQHLSPQLSVEGVEDSAIQARGQREGEKNAIDQVPFRQPERDIA